MFLPYLTELATSKDVVDIFAGYNHNLRIGDGEFYDMKNLTSTYYPVLSPRGKRGVYAEPNSPQGMIAKDALCYVDGESLVMNGYPYDIGLSTKAEDCPKKLISMGAYIIILPDAVWFNTENFESGQINAEFDTVSPTTFTLGRVDGEKYDIKYRDSQQPKPAEGEEIENMALWLDTSSTPHTLKQFSASSKMWVSIATTYIRIESPGIGAKFEVNDGVNISGLKDTELKTETGDTLDGNTASQIAEIDGSFVIWAKGDDYIVVIGLLDEEQTIKNKVHIERKMPAMDFVIESENRLWGCRYGYNNGKVINEIYASKLGDFKNWNCFMGVSTDSYAASVGTDGRFTGAVTHLGYPLFFKEGCLHKVYGNYPANYQIQTTACRGVQRDSEKSLAIVNEVLYYKSQNGICAYDGSLPNEISGQFGDEKYTNAVAAAHGNKYYVSMKDSNNKSVLFVYDASKGMWHKEDDINITDLCACRNELYFLADGKIGTMFGSGTVDKAPIPWMAESGVLTTGSPDKKYISRLSVRMSLDIGTKVYFYIQYDSMGEWEHVSTMTGSTLRTFTVPIKPKRCDHMRLRIVGEGNAKVYSITKTIENGSDV